MTGPHPVRPRGGSRGHASLRIPAIGVSAPIIPIGLHKDRTIQVPQDFGKAGWYKLGPKPGARGPAVIVGHVDSKTGPAIFYRLRELKPGNRILIRGAGGRTVRFRVNGPRTVAEGRVPDPARVRADAWIGPATRDVLGKLRQLLRSLRRQHDRVRFATAVMLARDRLITRPC